MVGWEKHINSTNFYKSYLEKVVSVEFINSALALFFGPMVFASKEADFFSEEGLVFLIIGFILIDSLKKIIF